jgi:hypothetical protein
MTIVFDEYHLMGLANTKSQTYQAANDLLLHEDGQKILLSGTPMGGKPIRLWGALHFLEPDAFIAMWRWAKQWLEIEEVDTGAAGMKQKIHGIAQGSRGRVQPPSRAAHGPSHEGRSQEGPSAEAAASTSPAR